MEKQDLKNDLGMADSYLNDVQKDLSAIDNDIGDLPFDKRTLDILKKLANGQLNIGYVKHFIKNILKTLNKN